MSADLSAKRDPLANSGGGSGSESTSRQDPPSDHQGSKSPKLLIGLVIAAIVAAIIFFASRPPAEDPNIVRFSGRIESRETYITAGVGARVQSVSVREGDTVKQGQLLLTLDPGSLRVKMHATGSEEALARQAQSQADNQVQMAQQDVDKARAKSKGFLAKIFGSKKKKEEETARLTAEMKSAQTSLFQAKAAVIKAQAAKGEVASKTSYFTITSPIDGIVVTRSIEPGEAVAPGQILLSIIDPNSIYMKGFIPEGNLSQVKIGQAAQIILDGPQDKSKDSKDGHRLNARITAIDTAPSFTPQNVYFKEDRIKQVFGIKLAIDSPDGTAKPGMPADAEIKLKQEE